MTENDYNQASSKHGKELDQFKVLLQKYGSHALTVVLIVLIAVMAVNFYRFRQERRVVEAGRRLSSARSVADLEAVARDFEKSPVAPLAVLALAKQHFDNGNYGQALFEYERFLVQWPSHEMADVAALGRIFCIEARGHHDALEEAASAFGAFAADYPVHYLAPQALLGRARCLEQLGRLEEARAIYEDFIAGDDRNPWVIRAEELLESVQRRIERRATAILPPEEDAD